MAPSDFRRALRGDLRLLDWLFLSAQGKKTRGQARKALAAAFGLRPRDLASAVEGRLAPHFPTFGVSRSKNPDGREAPSFPLDPKTYMRDNSVCVFNRRLHAELPPHLWEASCNLYRRTPRSLGRLWKAFHFQNTARLRLAILFNTFDLLQRLVTLTACAATRDNRELCVIFEAHEGRGKNGRKKASEFLKKGTIGAWHGALDALLTQSRSPHLTHFQTALLSPLADADAMRDTLAPIVRLLGLRESDLTARTALEGFRVMGDLRNWILGHGAIGSRLSLDAATYVGALHRYFLAMISELVKLDLTVYAFRDVRIHGWTRSGFVYRDVDDGAGPTRGRRLQRLRSLPGDGGFLDVSPYLRYANGRLVILDRLRSPAQGSSAHYVDYQARDFTKPTYVSIREPLSRFLGGGGSVAAQEAEVQLCRETGNQRGLIAALGYYALALQSAGDLVTARTVREEEVSVCRASGNKAKLLFAHQGVRASE